MAQYWYEIGGESGTWTPQGWSVQHSVKISGVAGYAYGKALTGLTTLGVIMGMQHPGYTDSYLQSVSWAAEASDIITYTLNFEPMTGVPIQINLEGGLEGVETNKDRDDNPTFVSYTYPSDYKHDPAKQGMIETVVKTYTKDIPTCRMVVTIRSISTVDAIQALNDTYAGKVNAADWNLMPEAEADTWRCDTLSATYVGVVYTAENGLEHVFDIQYPFTFRKDKWITSLAFTDNSTGEVPPEDTWTANTVKDYYPYTQIDFSGLTTWVVSE